MTSVFKIKCWLVFKFRFSFKICRLLLFLEVNPVLVLKKFSLLIRQCLEWLIQQSSLTLFKTKSNRSFILREMKLKFSSLSIRKLTIERVRTKSLLKRNNKFSLIYSKNLIKSKSVRNLQWKDAWLTSFQLERFPKEN